MQSGSGPVGSRIVVYLSGSGAMGSRTVVYSLVMDLWLAKQ